MNRLASRLSALLLIVAQGCAMQAMPSSRQSFADGSITAIASSHATIDAEGSAVPGFFFQTITSRLNQITEYARNASGNTPPLRVLRSRGFLLGVDKHEQLYTLSAGQSSCAPCKVFVQSYTGQMLRTIVLPPDGTSLPGSVSVDRNGSIYYIMGCSRIIQLPAGATTTEKPLRSINIPPSACPAENMPYIPRQLFADPNGNVYLYARYHQRGVAYYAWGPTAKGSAKARIIKNAAYQVMGIDRKGSVWTLDIYTTLGAFVYPPNASGSAQPKTVALGGLTGLNVLRIVSSTQQVVYEGFSSKSPSGIRLAIAPPSGGTPVRTINLPSYFTGDDLVGVSF